jgi:hypothetical protein
MKFLPNRFSFWFYLYKLFFMEIERLTPSHPFNKLRTILFYIERVISNLRKNKTAELKVVVVTDGICCFGQGTDYTALNPRQLGI